VNRLCHITGLSRAGYYRFRRRHECRQAGMTLRNQIQHIALRWPAYGYRRVHAELVRQGWKINHKRVLRLMRSHNLLCVRRRKFLFTTDSRHGLPIYPNLIEGMLVTSIDQLWVADITYIRLQLEFVYLAVLLDAFSRRCLGWALRRSLEAALAAGSPAHGAAASQAETRAGASLRSRRAIRFPGLCYRTPTTRHPHQHEPYRFTL
jgi:putative transposase